jgi:predicted alpha-1,2-mannosidase
MNRFYCCAAAFAMAFGIVSCNQQNNNLTQWVDPFLGTGGHGHVYPAATIPFGMVQVGPDNGVDGWDWCSGYNYSSTTIAGFSHTHLSGTGIGDGYDISVLPLTSRDSIYEEKIHLPFSHTKESAKPGYYEVLLDNGVKCEMTATERSGLHRYTFSGDSAWLRWDPSYHQNWDLTDSTEAWVLNDSTIAGYKHSTGWAKNQRVYFHATFNQPFIKYEFIGDSLQDFKDIKLGVGKRANDLKLLLQFKGSNTVEVRVGISNVSIASAAQSHAEHGNRSFEKIVMEADQLWEKELSKIKIPGNDPIKKKFYTALYRTALAPNIYSDKKGNYRNADGRILKMETGKEKFSTFSTWDTFRALHPLFTITQQDRVPFLINSMLQFYKDNGLLPVWDISSWEANTMTGFHSVPIIADAILKDIQGFDYTLAYNAMKASANQTIRGTQAFNQYGYVPHDLHGWSVTYTLEYAFDNWCIAQVAEKLGYEYEAIQFKKRANNYKKLFDASTGFMRGKLKNGNWVSPFDPYLSEHGFEGQYIEGTAWQHSFFVPHDVLGLAELYGSRQKLIDKLDTLFTTTSELRGNNISIDVSGLIGQYAHGNEPSHHIAYMYTILGKPEKAAHFIRIISDSLYKEGPEGISGNDDCGQMSAWYIFSSLGFYPLNPASGDYVIGFPLLKEAIINVGDKKQLIIKKKGQGKSIQYLVINGRKSNKLTISHTEILQGGLIEMITN